MGSRIGRCRGNFGSSNGKLTLISRNIAVILTGVLHLTVYNLRRFRSSLDNEYHRLEQLIGHSVEGTTVRIEQALHLPRGPIPARERTGEPIDDPQY